MKIAINSKTNGKFEKRFLNNREHIVTSMVPIVGNSVMNGGLYPLAEVQNSFDQLHNLPAPNGHPKVGNQLMSAFHPLAMNAFNIGGMVRNPKMDGDKVVNEFWLDTEIANQTPDGQELIRRIENNEEVGVSTGLNVKQEICNGEQDGIDYSWIANDLNFDHVAILLNEEAAGAHVGTKLQTNTDSNVTVVNCAVLDAPAGTQIPGVIAEFNDEGIINKVVSKMEKMFGLKSNAITTDSLSQQLRQQAKEIWPEDLWWAWTFRIWPTINQVVFELEEKSTGITKLIKCSFTVDEKDQVSLNDDKVEVKFIVKEEFVEVDGDVNVNNSNPEEDEIMAEKKKPNEQGVTNDDKLNVENAIKLLEEKGFKVNSKEENEQLQFFIDNREKFESVINAEEADLKVLRENLVANSDMTEEDVKDMGKDMLNRLSKSLNPSQNYQVAGGNQQRVDNSEASDEDFEEDYTANFDDDAEGGK